MLENPKKKSKMWTTIAEELKSLNIEVSSLPASILLLDGKCTNYICMCKLQLLLQVTSDQVRWKINALTKRYKDCVDNGLNSSDFKYFNEMHQILGRYSDDTGTYRLASGVQRDAEVVKSKTLKAPFRKLRAERQAKVELDKQWMEYLKKQDEQKQIRDERLERSLILREEKLQLQKKELELKQSLALKKLQLKQRKHEELLKIEREKCELLMKLVEKKLINEQDLANDL